MESNFSIFTQDDIHKVEGGNINSDYSFIEESESEAEDINANEPEYYDSFGMKLNTYTYKNLTLIKDNGRTEKDDETARIIESLVKQGLNIIEEQLEEIQKEKDYQKYNHSYNRYKEYRYTTRKRNRDYSSQNLNINKYNLII